MENPTKLMVTNCTKATYKLKARTQIFIGLGITSFFVFRILLTLFFNL
jgi:hypothetical protein